MIEIWKHKTLLGKCIFLIGLIIFAIGVNANGEQVVSPDGKVAVKMSVKAGQPYYNLSWKGKELITDSTLGIQLGASPFEGGFGIVGETKSNSDTTWKPVWGQFSAIRNNYNQMAVELLEQGSLKRKMQIVFRAYNDGIAFRYVFEKQSDLNKFTINSENTEFCFAGDHTVWYPNHRWAVSIVGPGSLSEVGKNIDTGINNNSVINKHITKNIEAVKKRVGKKESVKNKDANLAVTPMTIKAADDVYVCIHEAALDNYASMNLKLVKGKEFAIKSDLAGKVTCTAPMKSPWRVIMLADKCGGLLESNIIENLNEPCVIKDTSWIKPGISMWDYRVRGAKVDGFTYGLDTASMKRLIDFASANKLQYAMVDSDWYGPEKEVTSDPVTHIDAIDIPWLAKYAKEKNVGLWVYINTIALKNYDIDKTLSTYQKWGIVGIKQGFLTNPSQKGVEFCHKVVKKCAEYGLMYDCHECVKPSGFERTYPNLMMREYNHSLADGNRIVDPSLIVKMCFVNMVAGPLDHTPGMFDLNTASNRDFIPGELKTTVAAQTARCLVIYTPVLCLADHGEAYEKKADMFEFIKQLPMNWDETKVINGKIGEYITIARRNGEAWFVGSLTDEKAREVEVPLDFLGKGKYTATVYADAADAHYINNREAYEVKTMTVTSKDVIKAKMAAGGGHSIWIRPAAKK